MNTQFFVYLVLGWLLIFQPNLCAKSFEKDPIKDTQTNPVPVTEELLKSEGQKGPASPTFKVEDSSKFLVKKGVEKAENEEVSTPKEEPSKWWDDWFQWGEEKEEKESDSASDS